MCFGVSREIASFRNILADDFVYILHRSFLPRMIRMAEVDFDIEDPFQFFVMLKQDIVVRCHTPPFRVTGCDTNAGICYLGKGQAEDLLQETHS